MNDLIKFINENSGLINLFFSFTVAISTCFYAYLTLNLVRETKRLREVQTEPLLEVFYQSYEDAMPLLEFVVKNVGQGTAYHIDFKITNEASGNGVNELLDNLKKMQIFKTGMNLLCSGQEYRSYWTDVRINAEDKLKVPIRIVSSCKSSTGLTYEKIHILDLSELEGKTKLGTHPFYKMAKSLEIIQKDIAGLCNGSRRLKVDSYTELDRKKEKQRWNCNMKNFAKIKNRIKILTKNNHELQARLVP